MPRTSVNFERQALYNDVWREPLTKLAARYGLADVGLRKICLQLSIPLPERGYWAKLAAGKTVPQKPLLPTTGPSTYHFERWVASADEELEKRVAAAVSTESSVPILQRVELRGSVEETHPLVRSTAAYLKKAYGDTRGWPSTAAGRFFEVAVAIESQTYALLLLDAVIRTFLAAGYKLFRRKDGRDAAHFNVEGEALTVRLWERSTRTERELTKEEKKEKELGEYVYIRDRYSYHSTGDFKLEVMLLENKYRAFTMRPSRSRKLEDWLPELPIRCANLARETKVRRQLDEERRLAEQKRQMEDHQLAERRRKALERLASIEKKVERWTRAERLRSFANAYEAFGEMGVEQRAYLDWVLNAADWLDPLVRQHWPEVDDAPRSSYLDPAGYA